MGPSLVTAGRQQDLKLGGKKKTPDAKEGLLFISTFDSHCRHIAVSKELPLGSASMPPAGAQHQKASPRPLGSASFVLTLPASHKILSRGRSPGDKPKENNVSR